MRMQKVTLFVVIWAVIISTSSNAQDLDDIPLTSGVYDLKFHDVAPGVWMAERPNFWRVPIVGNIVIIEGRDSVMLFDGGRGIQTAVQLINFINSQVQKPVSHLVLSHWHNDHTLGIDVLKQAFPDMKTIAHQFTTDYIRDTLSPRVAKGGANIEGLLRDVEKELANNTDFLGRELTAAARAENLQILADKDDLRIAYHTHTTLVPDISINDHMTIDLGGRMIELNYIGFGNTEGDLIGWLPKDKILMSGDIITHPVPFGYPFEPRKTVETMKRLIAYDFKQLILGHGDIQTDRDYENKVISLISWVNDEVDRLITEGKTLEETQSAIDLSKAQADFADGDPWIKHRFENWFIQPIVQRSYNEIIPKEEN